MEKKPDRPFPRAFCVINATNGVGGGGVLGEVGYRVLKEGPLSQTWGV